ncbi:hypothetical protein H5410_026908 [Solanum commersonii]|uniref:Uncharacterized protein n=1 Tax=Solanum commersonii TaxID=4109 RepID=A0A9J5Z089_SOLCO|nr:hypothetical protein H5410_026908 [Solanum commersonii]
MTEAFKRLNAKVEALLQENTKLMEQIKSLKGKDSIQKINIDYHGPREKSFPSRKNGWRGCAFPSECKRSTVSDNKDLTSPDQAVVGKDTSNPFMVRHFAKSEGEGSSSVAELPGSFIEREQDKHVITPPNPDPNGDRLVPDIERNRPNTSPRNTNNNITRSNSSEEDYREHSYYQDASKSQCG